MLYSSMSYLSGPVKHIYIATIDIGGTWIRTALVTTRGQIIKRARRPTPTHATHDVVIATCVECLNEIGALENGASAPHIGVSVTGPVDPQSGILYIPPNTDSTLAGLQLGPLLHKATGKEIRVERDTNVAALGEYAHGAAHGIDNFVYMTLSTGVGGAVMLDGKLMAGHNGTAGEIGHISVRAEGPTCGCGRTGCLESLASGPALARNATQLARTPGSEGSLARHVASGKALTGAQVDTYALAGDPIAQEVLADAANAVTSACVDLANVFDPAVIVIGGSVAEHHPEWIRDANAAVQRQALTPTKDTARVVSAALGDDVSLIGAAHL